MSDVLVTSVKELILRDLNKLKQEISAYTTESSIWVIEKDIKNSAGNLCLHLCGNLQHYIGAVLGQSGYKRNRPAEFSTKDVAQSNLIKEIETTIHIIDKTLSKLSPVTIDLEYPEQVFDRPMSTGYFLIHLAGHLNYHLGQVNYHKRLIGKTS